MIGIQTWLTTNVRLNFLIEDDSGAKQKEND